MDRKDTLKTIDEHYEHASTLALNLIESEARKILTADPDLDEFIMAMGSCFFTHKEKGIVYAEVFQADFMEMVEDLNETYKVMGYPMRFTATGKIINDW
jgi:hypothetical protein